MKRRFTGSGEFTDREGNVVKLTAFVAEFVPADGGTIGGLGPSSTSVSENETAGMEGSGEEGAQTGGLFDSTEGTARVVEDTPARVQRVWACFVDTHQPRRKEAGAEERKIISAALKVATVEECCQAIMGNKRSAFHQGHNDRSRKYNRISQILKGRQGKETTRERIDYFIDLYSAGGGDTAAVTSEAQFKIDNLKDRVRRGNGNEDGKKAEAQLWERYRISTAWERQHRPHRGAHGNEHVPVFTAHLRPVEDAE